MGIPLTAVEQPLCDEVTRLAKDVWERIEKSDDRKELPKLIEEMGVKAHKLHLSLEASGHCPVHHKFMIENRGMPANHPDFYKHIHPVEDLLAYIKDPSANNDSEDQTIGHEFFFKVYSKRWKREDTYQITRTDSGWVVDHISISGPCDKGGRPFLFKNFQQDSIQYPNGLSLWFELLWDQAADNGLDHNRVQSGLNLLADWVSATEEKKPDEQF